MCLAAGAYSEVAAVCAPCISLLLSMTVVYDPSSLSFWSKERDEWDYKQFVHHAFCSQPSLHHRTLFLSQRLFLAKELSLNQKKPSPEIVDGLLGSEICVKFDSP